MEDRREDSRSSMEKWEQRDEWAARILPSLIKTELGAGERLANISEARMRALSAMAYKWANIQLSERAAMKREFRKRQGYDDDGLGNR